MIVRFNVPDLLATLAVNFLLTGLQLIPTAGRSIATGLILPDGKSANGVFDPAFLSLGRARLFDVVPLPVLIMLMVAIAAGIFTERTRFGRLIFAVGGNEVAARLAGARTGRLKVLAYMPVGKPRRARRRHCRGPGRARRCFLRRLAAARCRRQPP